MMLGFLRNFATVRRLLWRLGRKIYTFARGEGRNDPDKNGEYWALELVITKSRDAPIFLDIGANIGNWTAKALELASTTKVIQVMAFEPSSGTRSILRERFHLNDSVVIHPYALSDREGQAVFYSENEGAGTNSLSPTSGRDSETVNLITIDRLVKTFEIKSVAMAKIDTEGFDLLVLKGAAELLRNGGIEVVQFEYNWRWLLNHACLRDVFEFIADKPYRLGKLSDRQVEFYEEWHFELDRFFETNFVLVRSNSSIFTGARTIRFDESNVGIFSEGDGKFGTSI